LDCSVDEITDGLAVELGEMPKLNGIDEGVTRLAAAISEAAAARLVAVTHAATR